MPLSRALCSGNAVGDAGHASRCCFAEVVGAGRHVALGAARLLARVVLHVAPMLVVVSAAMSWRVGAVHEVRVVEADHRDVLRDRHAHAADRSDRSKCERVGGADDAGDAEPDQPVGHGLAAFEGEHRVFDRDLGEAGLLGGGGDRGQLAPGRYVVVGAQHYSRAARGRARPGG